MTKTSEKTSMAAAIAAAKAVHHRQIQLLVKTEIPPETSERAESFLKGLSRIFGYKDPSVRPEVKPVDTEIAHFVNVDKEALRSDWTAVGGDMRVSLKKAKSKEINVRQNHD